MKKVITTALMSVSTFGILASTAFAQVTFPTTLGSTFGLTTKTLKESLISIVNYLLGFLGILAIAIILGGGFKWMTSGGDDGKVSSARNMIIAGIIGLAIVLAAFAIVRFVVNTVGTS